jgi:hypothetical protein
MMKHRHTASDDSSYSQSSIVPIHAHNPVLETAYLGGRYSEAGTSV